MAEFDLNLSTRPFPPYRLINIALGTILVLLLAFSLWQTRGFIRFSRLARVIRTAEVETRIEAESLGKRGAELESRLDRPEATAKLNEIGFLNRLITRKNFSWTRLLADLETLVPNNVHLLNLAPEIGANGAITLQIDLLGRSIADISEFIHRLEKSPVFQNISVSTEQKRQLQTVDFNVRLSVVYRPERQVQLAVVGVVNLLFFFILYQPARSEYYRLQDSVEGFRREIDARRQRIDLLERLNAQLATLEQDRQRLFSMHFIPRNAGWSEILVRLDAMVREAEVQNTHKDYGIDQAPQYGLYSVKIRIPVVGAYPEVVNFIKDLEDSETFFIIDSIDLHGTDSPASESSDISLGLNVETFFYQ